MPESSLRLKPGISRIRILPARDSLTPFMRWYVCEPVRTMRSLSSDWSTTHFTGEKSSGARCTSSMMGGRVLYIRWPPGNGRPLPIGIQYCQIWELNSHIPLLPLNGCMARFHVASISSDLQLLSLYYRENHVVTCEEWFRPAEELQHGLSPP